MTNQEIVEIIGWDGNGVAYDDPSITFVAKSGTGFNPDSPQHISGSDGLRYAIWIQQARDAKDWARVEKLREMARGFGWSVENAKTETRVKMAATFFMGGKG